MDYSKLKNTELFLFDMDGTLYLGDEVYNGAIRLMEDLPRLGKKYIYLTNNSSRAGTDYITRLKGLGFPCEAENVFTSGMATGMYLNQNHPGAKVYLVGTQAFRRELLSYGIQLVEENADVVVVGFDTELVYEKLNKFTRQCLEEALLLLLEKKSLQEISVSELCAKAGVSRMTFYARYKTKENLFEQIIRTLNKDFINAVGSPFVQNADLDWYKKFFGITKQNADAIKLVFSADKYRYLSVINGVVLANAHLTEEQRSVRLMWTGAMVNAVIYWFDSGLRLSVEEMASTCCEKLAALACG